MFNGEKNLPPASVHLQFTSIHLKRAGAGHEANSSLYLD